MTIVNLHLSPSRAVLLTDTLVADLSGREDGRASKTLLFPHLRAATALRGPAWILHNWFVWVSAHVASVDELRSAQERAVRNMFRVYMDRHAPEGVALDGTAGTVEMVTVGWSASAGRVVGFANDLTRDFVTEDLEDGTHALPWIPGYPTTARVPLREVVREQLSLAAENGVAAPVGGEWFRTVVNRSGVFSRALQ